MWSDFARKQYHNKARSRALTLESEFNTPDTIKMPRNGAYVTAKKNNDFYYTSLRVIEHSKVIGSGKWGTQTHTNIHE